MKFKLTHLYPHHMELYGDMGNIHAIRWMLESVGYEMEYQPVEPGDVLPQVTHLYFIGGGQDKQQMVIAEDLISKGDQIKKDVADGLPLLAICGGYQLLGREFVTGDGESIPGVGLFPVVTKALDTSVASRSIGDVVLRSNISDLSDAMFVGFENHSGQTYFEGGGEPLGYVTKGSGNNYIDDHEGCVVKYAVGTYLHGSCLPKNPELTQWLINASLKKFAFPNPPVKVNTQISLKAKEQRLRI